MSTLPPPLPRSRSSWPIPGFGTLHLEPIDQHPGLVRIAAAGLVATMLLGTLGMPPVDLHGPTHHIGIMGPLCGMTRSVARAATGEIVGAWRYNPGGLVLVAGAWACVARTVIGRRAGRWLNLRLVVSPGGWSAIAAVLVAMTVNQHLHAQLLA